MRNLVLLCLGLTFVGALVSLFVLHVPVAVLATWGMGALCLAWLVALVTLPWNIYFQAKAVLFEVQRSKERGIAVRPEREAEAERVKRRMLRFSIGSHLGSAALLAAITWVSGAQLGYYFAAFYLLSTFFRPGVEYYRYLRQRLTHILGEVHYPRQDVLTLVGDVEALKGQVRAHAEQARDLERQLGELRERSQARYGELERRLGAVARKFEETVDRLSDNQQLIGGIKAFLRMVQQPGPASEP